MRGSITLLLVVSVSSAGAVSFDCSKARNFAEESVCADTDLSRLDDALSRIYPIALEHVTDKKKLRAEQRKWLERRNACDYSKSSNSYERKIKQKSCLQHAYNTRLRELNTIVFSQTGMGHYRCGSPTKKGGTFVIANGIVTEFNAATAVSGPEFARGYTLTCVHHINKFYQTAGGKKSMYCSSILPMTSTMNHLSVRST